MRKEIDPKWALAVIAVILLALAFGAWRMWSVPTGLKSPKEAGLGRPMKPGEIPGQSGGVNAPIGGPR